MKEEKNTALNQSLAKGIKILESFGPNNPTWGVRELARRINTNPTTISKLVHTLHINGYLEKVPETRRYRLGPRVIRLASVYSDQNQLPDIARLVFDSYSDRFEYNFYLGRLHEFTHEVIYLAVKDGRGPIKVIAIPGGVAALHASALGKVLLAFQDDEFIQNSLSNHKLTPYTKYTITDKQTLLGQLLTIREKGYARNDGEFYEAVGAIGVPMFGPGSRLLHAVSLAYPRELLSERRALELVPLAQQIADDISLRCYGKSSSDFYMTGVFR